MSERINLLTPVGRLVGGSLYTPTLRKNRDGSAKLKKDGTPLEEFWIPIAIPKTGEQHWYQTPWGKVIWDCGVAAFGQIASSPAFAWKITDGDSAVPNKKGKAPRENIGYPGHWVLNFGGTTAPKIVNRDASAFLLEVDAVRPGNLIQIGGSVSDNKPAETPGVYLNYAAISLQGYHPDGELEFGPDPKSFGFGQAPLPAGASVTPIGGLTPTAVASFSQPPAPGVAPSHSGTHPQASAAAPAPLAVAPHPAFLAPAPAPAPAAPPSPPAGPQMTPKATAPYAAYVAQGWTDALLREHGYML